MTPPCYPQCPLRLGQACTLDMHPACIPCDHYRATGRVEDARAVGRETGLFTAVAGAFLALVVGAALLAF